MCDTIGRIISSDYAIFGKNSDRAVNEPQLLEFHAAKDHQEGETLKCTYISIPEARHTNAIVLSRPSWIWGGEIGVNEFGVCIGNEAVFTKGPYGKDALIGMDLLRLGLERGSSAKQALEAIIDLLQRYGQGGNCGYDSDFHYDNSFLIMDREDLYVLETKDKEYVYKKCDHTSISNCLSIEDDGDRYSGERINFRKRYSDFIMTTGSKGKTRRSSSLGQKLEGLEDMMAILRSHTLDGPFLHGTVGSVCMHASNPLTADETTMSMIVELKKDDIIIWTSGSSCPCISLYKPHLFEPGGLIANEDGQSAYWYSREEFNRRFLNALVPSAYREDLDRTQKEINRLDRKDYAKAMDLDEEFHHRYKDDILEYRRGNLIYSSFWKRKNAILAEEMGR